MWASSDPFLSGVQLGETAFPILLLDLLRREGVLEPKAVAQYWPMVRRAVAYIVRSGPSTQEDRWENQNGYTPYTLANVIAALLVAADVADDQGEESISTYLRETADAWNSAIESWLYVTGTELARRVGVEGYYVRIVPAGLNENSTPKVGHMRLKANPPSKNGKIPITDVISPDALAFVRYGMRRPDDPRILNTIKVIDAVNKVETPFGPCWHRYNGGGYGEHDDGAPYQETNRGHGRAWPLLTGERAHYELMAGRLDEALRLLHTLEAFAGDGGMIPEQVWDADDLPEQGLFKGRPSGSAMPLVWAHAEYIKLRRSLSDGRVFDLPPQTAQRYLVDKIRSNLVIWRFDHKRLVIAPGEVMRVEVQAPALVHWSIDGWKTAREVSTLDTGLGIHIADLPTNSLRAGDQIVMTFRWPEADDRWEGNNFTTNVIDES
ncbi:MAG: glycoside hydrolase family 15 protein, partial [Isosphaeraceae bacterium]